MESNPYYVSAESGPFLLEFPGHPDEASFDAEAGEAGAMRDFAHRWHIHRDTINIFDRQFAPWLEATSGIPRLVDDELTRRRRQYSLNPNKITPLKERFVKYTKRVIATLEGEGKLELVAQIKAEALRVSRTIKINVAPAGLNGAVELMFYKRADSILEADLDTINSKVSRFLALVPDYELIRDHNEKPERASLARLLKKFAEAQMTQDD